LVRENGQDCRFTTHYLTARLFNNWGILVQGYFSSLNIKIANNLLKIGLYEILVSAYWDFLRASKQR